MNLNTQNSIAEGYISEYDKGYQDGRKKSYQDGRKEMAEKIMKEISGDILTVNTKEYGNIEVIPVERLQEICTNVIGRN